MRTLSVLLVAAGVIYLAFLFTAPNLLPETDIDPFLLGGGGAVAGIVLLMIDERARSKRKWKMGPLGK